MLDGKITKIDIPAGDFQVNQTLKHQKYCTVSER